MGITLQEMESSWSLDDLLRASAYLDIKDEIEQQLVPGDSD